MPTQTKSRTTHRQFGVFLAAMLGAVALVVTGCTSSAPAESDAGATAQAEAAAEVVEADGEDALTADSIVAMIEPHGFDCEVKEAVLDSRDEVVACKGADYVIISATSLVDPGSMQDALASAKDTVCKNQETTGVEGMTSGVSGKWVFVPGGDDEKNLTGFEAVMADFGIDWSTDPC